MLRAYLSLGSNLGDRARHLRSGLRHLDGDGVAVVNVSSVWETDPVGGPDQGRYLNLVAEVTADGTARELLERCQAAEAAAGRVRAERWGPRTLDVDVVLIEGATVDEPDLQVPHPRMWERRFVLAPLAEVAPHAVPGEALATAEGTATRLGRLGDL